jgi:hypothetical protein
MPGFNAKQLAYKVQNANEVIILIGDQQIAFAQTVTHSFDFGTEGLYGIGTAKPQEIQQLKNAPTITVDNFALSALGNKLTQNGQNLALLLGNNAFNICIVDGNTQSAVLTYVGAVAQNFNETIGANRPVTDAITFMALDVLDPDGDSILDGQNAILV